jgi:hypothetical protein
LLGGANLVTRGARSSAGVMVKWAGASSPGSQREFVLVTVALSALLVGTGAPASVALVFAIGNGFDAAVAAVQFAHLGFPGAVLGGGVAALAATALGMGWSIGRVRTVCATVGATSLVGVGEVLRLVEGDRVGGHASAFMLLCLVGAVLALVVVGIARRHSPLLGVMGAFSGMLWSLACVAAIYGAVGAARGTPVFGVEVVVETSPIYMPASAVLGIIVQSARKRFAWPVLGGVGALLGLACVYLVAFVWARAPFRYVPAGVDLSPSLSDVIAGVVSGLLAATAMALAPAPGGPRGG